MLATLVVVAAAVAGIRAAQGDDSPTALPDGGPVIVVGAPGLDWQDVSPERTPALWSLLRQGATATVTVRAVQLSTCPVDGWLSLSAGSRAGDVGPDGSTSTAVTASGTPPPCRALPHLPRAGSIDQVPRWPVWRAAADARPLDARPGLLAASLRRQGACVQAVGPGAALAAADPRGRVDRYTPFSSDLPLDRCPVTIVDVGAVRDPGDVDPDDAVRPTLDRDRQVRRSDRRIARVLDQAPDDARIVVTGLADAGRTGHLRLLAVKGPGIRPGAALHSPSTRQTDLVQSSDVTATVLDAVTGQVPEQVSGDPLQQVGGASEPAGADAAADRLRSLRDLGAAAQEVVHLVGPFFTGWAVLQLVVYGVAGVRWRRADRSTRHRTLAVVVAGCATVAAAVPAATYAANLLPWWRADVPALALVGAVALFTAVLGGVALAGPWRRGLLGPAGAVAAGTMLVLTLDVMTGSRLQLSSLLGEQPVVGGRFYGMGNVTFALFGTASLLLAVALAGPLRRAGERRLAAATVAAVGAAAVLVDAWPGWGADFGGPLALVPAMGFLFLAACGVRLTWRRAAAIIAVTVTLLVVVATLDWLRPEDSRTHLGRFVQTAIDGQAWGVVGRKLDQNLQMLVSSPLTLAVPVGLAVAVWMLARPDSRLGRLLAPLHDVPLLRPGLVALAICWVIGFVTNDSGTVVPAIGAMLAFPLLIAVAVRRAAESAGLSDDLSPASAPDDGLRRDAPGHRRPAR